MRKFIAYYRVSSEEQRKGKMSIPTQVEDVRAEALERGVRIVEEFGEAHSGRFPRARPEYERALTYLKQHPDIEGIMVFDVSRLARNITDGGRVLEELRRSLIVLGHGEISPDDPDAMFQFNVLLSASTLYSGQLSRRVTRGMKARLERGEFPGSRPLGLLVDSSVTPHSTKHDPERAPLIREMFEEADSQRMTVDQATLWAKKRGLRSRKGRVLSRSEIHFILRNPAYCGMVRSKYGIVPGRHVPVISRQLFDRVQEILDKRPAPAIGHRNPFKGLLHCAHCGRQITLTERPKGGKTYRYQHCYAPSGQCPRPSYREEELSDLLVAVLENVAMSPELSRALRQVAKDAQAQTQTYQREVSARVLALQAEIQRKREQKLAALRKHLEGLADEEMYLQVQAELDTEIALAEEKVRQLRAATPPRPDDIDRLFELVERGPALYLSQSTQERARLLRIVTSNLEVGTKTVVPVYRKPFSGIAEYVRTGDWWACLDSNQGPPAYQASALTN